MEPELHTFRFQPGPLLLAASPRRQRNLAVLAQDPVPGKSFRPGAGVEDADNLPGRARVARELGHLPVARDPAARDRPEDRLDPRGEVDRPGGAAIDRGRFPRAAAGTARAYGSVQRPPANVSIAARHSSRRAANQRSEAVYVTKLTLSRLDCGSGSGASHHSMRAGSGLVSSTTASVGG